MSISSPLTVAFNPTLFSISQISSFVKGKLRQELKEFEKDFFDTLSSGGSKCLLDTPFHFFSIQKAFVSLSLKQKKLFLKFMSYIIDSRLVSKDIMFPSIRIKYNKDKQD